VRALRLLQYDDIVQRHGQLALSEVNVQMVLLVELQWGIRVSPGGRGSFAVAEPGVEPQGIGIRLNHYEWVSVIVPTAALQKAAPSRTGPLGDGKIEFKVHGVQKVDEANKVIPLDLDWTRSTQITRTRTRSHVIFHIGDDYVGYGRSGCLPIIREHPAWHLRLNRVRALRLLQYDDIVQRHGQLALSEVDLQMVLLAELHGDSRVSPGGRGTSAVAEPGIEPLGTGILVHHYEWVSVLLPAAALKEATPSRTGPLGDGKIQFKVHLVRNVDGADDVIPLDLDWTRSTQITRTGTRNIPSQSNEFEIATVSVAQLSVAIESPTLQQQLIRLLVNAVVGGPRGTDSKSCSTLREIRGNVEGSASELSGRVVPKAFDLAVRRESASGLSSDCEIQYSTKVVELRSGRLSVGGFSPPALQGVVGSERAAVVLSTANRLDEEPFDHILLHSHPAPTFQCRGRRRIESAECVEATAQPTHLPRHVTQRYCAQRRSVAIDDCSKALELDVHSVVFQHTGHVHQHCDIHDISNGRQWLERLHFSGIIADGITVAFCRGTPPPAFQFFAGGKSATMGTATNHRVRQKVSARTVSAQIDGVLLGFQAVASIAQTELAIVIMAPALHFPVVGGTRFGVTYGHLKFGHRRAGQRSNRQHERCQGWTSHRWVSGHKQRRWRNLMG